jgi:hypothetical protein
VTAPAPAPPLFDRRDQSGDVRGPGWTVKRSKHRVVNIDLRFWVDPARADPEFERREVARLGQYDFDVQQGEPHAWDLPSGNPYLPTFAERVQEIRPWVFDGWYVRDCPAVFPQIVVRRGFDGGLRRPALILGQYDPTMGILWVQREFRPLRADGQPIEFLAHEFLAVTRYLCGQATIQDLEREEREGKWSVAAALAWIEHERRSPFYGWEMPWIPPGSDCRFIDVMASHESHKRSELAKDRESTSLRRVYRQHGLSLRQSTEGWDHRELVLAFLMREGPRPGLPRLLIDSSCKTLLKGMAGGLVLAPPGRRKPYVEDRYLEDAFDAFCNLMCSAFPLRHADRLAVLEQRQSDQRALAAGEAPAPRQAGLRFRQPTRISPNTWGGIRGSFSRE